MTISLRTVTLSTLLAGACMLVLCSGVRAQGTLFRGRVLDTKGNPVANAAVSLHRVTRGGGAMTKETHSAADGGFDFQLPLKSDTGAVFFEAARYADQLYLGRPFREPIPANGAYVVQVGPGALTASTLLSGVAQTETEKPPPTLTTRTVVLLLLLTFGTLALVVTA